MICSFIRVGNEYLEQEFVENLIHQKKHMIIVKVLLSQK